MSGTVVTICTTCRARQARSQVPAARTSQPDGQRLFHLADQQKQGQNQPAAASDVTVRPQECLWSCGLGCSVHVAAPGKISYALGLFAPDEAAASGILAFAAAHAQSADGTVAFEDWPQAVLGHFITRIIPPEWPAGPQDGSSGPQGTGS